LKEYLHIIEKCCIILQMKEILQIVQDCKPSDKSITNILKGKNYAEEY